MISLLLTLILCFTLDSCNNKGITLILGYNYIMTKQNDGNGTRNKNNADSQGKGIILIL